MTCRWCGNDNVLDRRTCPHCGEDTKRLEEAYAPENGPEHREEKALEGLRETVIAGGKSFAVSAVAVVMLFGGGKICYTHWPMTMWPRSLPPPTVSTTPVPSSSVTTSADPTAQAADIGSLLAAVHASKNDLPRSLGSCNTVASDIEPLRELIDERDKQNTTASNLETGALPDGDELKEALMEMTQASLDADRAYLDWAEQAQSSLFCTAASHDSSITAANKRATAAKRHFAELWNSTAQMFEQTLYNSDDF